MLQNIPDEVSLLWIAKFLGLPPSRIYELRRSGLGPPCEKLCGRYVVTKPALIAWLAVGSWKPEQNSDEGGML
jgi:hypothetical protein